MAGFAIWSRFAGHPGRSAKTRYALRLKSDHSIGAGHYRRRNRTEIMFGRPKDWRRVATRYGRCAGSFLPPSPSRPPLCSGCDNQ
jgi:transposase